LTKEFGAGASAEEVCARSIRELSAAGVKHFYISNLPIGKAAATLRRILALAGSDGGQTGVTPGSDQGQTSV
jgi:hypothetical protein